jgi:hypothetical protein
LTLPSRERIEEMRANLGALTCNKKPEEVYFETRADWIEPLIDCALAMRRLEDDLRRRNYTLHKDFADPPKFWAGLGSKNGAGPDLLSALRAALDKAGAP